jgi:hypothetical protein
MGRSTKQKQLQIDSAAALLADRLYANGTPRALSRATLGV